MLGGYSTHSEKIQGTLSTLRKTSFPGYWDLPTVRGSYIQCILVLHRNVNNMVGVEMIRVNLGGALWHFH